MLFGTFDNFRGQGFLIENETSIAMQNAYVAFIKNGANGLKATGWEPYMLGSGDVREFGAGIAVKDTSLGALEAQCNGPTPAS